MSTPIALRFLGTFEAHDPAGQPIDTLASQPRLIAVLAFLVTGGNACRSRDDVMGLLWPDSSTDRARHSLNQALYQLRAMLGSDAVTTRGSVDICLDRRVLDCDVQRFEAAIHEGRDEDALALWRGDFLEGFRLAGSSVELEHWLDAEQRRFRRRVVACAVTLSDLAMQRGSASEALRTARLAAELEPFDESIALKVMGALEAMRNPAAALVHYRAFERSLADELGLAPTPDLRGRAARIEAQYAARGDDRGETATGFVPPPSQPSAATALHVQPVAVDSDLPLRSRRERLLWILPAGLAASLVLGAAAAILHDSDTAMSLDLVSKRLAVAPFENRTGDSSLDPVGYMAADWIIQGALSAGLAEVVSSSEAVRAVSVVARRQPQARASSLARDFALGTHSGLLLTGTYYRLGSDSIAFHAEVVETRSGRIVRAIGPVPALRTDLATGVHSLGEQVVGSVATLLDRRLEQWSDRASQPHSIDAYRLLVDGIDAWLMGPLDLPRRVEHRSTAKRRFQEAYAADSTFTMALIWEYFAALTECTNEEMSGIQDRLRRKRAAMPPWDRAMADYAIAFGCGARHADGHAALAAARRAFEYAPDSEWGYKVAWVARWLLEFKEAETALNSIDPERGWISAWPAYWGLLAEVHHQLGEYQDELYALGRFRRVAKRSDPYSLSRALIGLGDVDSAGKVIRTVLDTEPRRYAVPPGMAAHVSELRWHGFGEQADSLTEILHQRWIACGTACSDSVVASIGGETPMAEMAWEASIVFSESHPDLAVTIRQRAVAAANRRQILHTLGWYGYSLGRAGRTADALRVAEQLADVDLTGYEYQHWQIPYFRALIYAAIGDQDEALRFFETAVEESAIVVRHGIHPDPLAFLMSGNRAFAGLTRIR